MGIHLISVSGAMKITSDSGLAVVTNGGVKVQVVDNTRLMFSQPQGFGPLLDVQLSEIESINGEPPSGDIDGLLAQLAAVFPDALAAAGAVTSVNGETPDSGGNVELTAAEIGVFAGSPTAQIGLAAINGAATTFMPSDAAPALDQAIVPTWTAIHTFNNQIVAALSSGLATPSVQINTSNPQLDFRFAIGSADEKRWNIAASGQLLTFRTLNDAGSAASNIFTITRSGNVVQQHDYFTGGTARITITNSGVGFGTIPTSPLQLVPGNIPTAGGSSFRINGGSFTAGSGTSRVIYLEPTYNQSGTASSNDIEILRTETALGSGSHNFVNFIAGDSRFRVQNTGKILLDTTVTPSGTTGDRTINKPSGTVNFAAGAATLTVTNNTVTTESIVLAVVRANDATAMVKNVAVGSGSFTINLNAAANAETSVGFIVFN